MPADLLIETSILDQVDGSSSWSHKNVKVVASATGPIEPRQRDEVPTEATLDLIVRPATGVITTREQRLESQICQVFSSVIIRHMFPRSLIQLVVQILESGEPVQYVSYLSLLILYIYPILTSLFTF